MTRSTRTVCALALCWPVLVSAADNKYSIKSAASQPPKEFKEPFAKLLEDRAVQLFDAKGELLAEVWLRKEVPAKATPAQIKNGLTYREVEETTLLGAIRFAQQVTDYRQQRIKPGVYTLRLGFQPMDGDHMGTAPFNEFCVLVPASQDESPDTLKSAKTLFEKSLKATGTSHPAVLLLFPGGKEDAPALLDKGNGHWVLNVKEKVVVGSEKTALGIGLTLIGHAAE